ncbi:uncharacterized protein TRIREDRAFT_108639 [Trichoderma reesei QM6a]|uniref:Predicted protein n=1 Tax=Hypocrea jecorina (strain QM6a) TaxID=431241 RepID=G0RMD0_HYPJQ|nr:uncharacterized protein TRIREDRAFT_108639 [Trichoderma reesei QM6a]EGR47855.1 predicted protein [Trichoderma reesei QM6a]
MAGAMDGGGCRGEWQLGLRVAKHNEEQRCRRGFCGGLNGAYEEATGVSSLVRKHGERRTLDRPRTNEEKRGGDEDAAADCPLPSQLESPSRRMPSDKLSF